MMTCKACESLLAYCKKKGWRKSRCYECKVKEFGSEELASFGRVLDSDNAFKENLEASIIQREADADFDSVYPDYASNPAFD